VRRRLHDPASDFPAFVSQFLADKGREVVMVVRDRRGHVWLHRKGYWRLPSGNLHPGEEPTSGALREVEEEFGAPLPLVRPLGVLELETGVPDAPAGAPPFVAHLFLFAGGAHVPGPVPAEGIDAWRAVPVAELAAEAARLRALRPTAEPNGWMNPYWGAFRALELEVAADLLRAAGGRGAA
jgi:8-oxo-dGTP pyrophosphatase MutT (NUDIX family)